MAEVPTPPSPPAPTLVLASASPRRQELLRDAGYAFVVDPSNVDEEDFPPRLLPGELAGFLARLKAEAVSLRHPEAVVLAADTVVAFGDQSLGKPEDETQARQMLALLSGTTHIVVTGVSVLRAAAGVQLHRRVMSAVHMRPLSRRDIDAYVDSGLWRGKAGGYGIQDRDPFVVRMAGCHSNIVGLPMTTTRRMLAEAGIAVPASTCNPPDTSAHS